MSYADDPATGSAPDSATGSAPDSATGSGSGSYPATGSASEPAVDPAGEPATPTRQGRSENMLPGRERRRFGLERVMVRIVATCGIVGIGVLLAAILASSNVQGWIIGLTVASVSVILSAVLWSSRQL